MRRKTLLYDEITPLEVSLIPVSETEALLPAEQDKKKHEPFDLPIEIRAPQVKRDQEIPQMTKSHSMNHCSCHPEIGVPSLSNRLEQMTHTVAEAKQNEVTHKCSWTFCLSLGTNSVTRNLPSPSWCWWKHVSLCVRKLGLLVTHRCAVTRPSAWCSDSVGPVETWTQQVLGTCASCWSSIRSSRRESKSSSSQSIESPETTLGGVSRAISSSHPDELHLSLSQTRDTRATLCASRKQCGPEHTGTRTQLIS